MSQVAARILAFYVEQAQKHGKPEGWLLEGTDYDLKDLPEWIPWDDFCELTERIGALLGPEAMEEAGTEIVKVSDVSFITRVLGAGLSPRRSTGAARSGADPRFSRRSRPATKSWRMADCCSR